MIRPVEYTVSLGSPQTQTFEASMRVRNLESPVLDVALPAWRQGRYAILDPAGTIYNVRAEDSSGARLPIVKTDKASWRVQTAGRSEAVISYTVYANSLNDRSRHVDDTHAFLSGATVFLYSPKRRHDPLSVRIVAPESWKIASGMERDAGDPTLLLASGYDVLIDSPIEAGIHDTLRFVVDSKPHDIVIWGDARYDGERLKQDLSAIVRTEAELWGTLPYERYVFILHVAPGLRGGTEHLNSTIMQVQPTAFEDEQEYWRLLSLAAHELFHTWNVKRLRPAALREPDLGKENYTELLWFCEGTTAYYDELLVVRAGLQSAETYLASIAETIYQVRARPGSRVQSVAESSFDAWIKFNRPTPHDMNATVSFYESGALVSLLLDLEIRKRTLNRVSLDTLLRQMYQDFPASGPGFTAGDLVATANRLTGTRFEEFFESYVEGTNPYPFEGMLDVVGLQMVPIDGSPKPYIGMSVQESHGGPIVRTVLADGPAYLAGVNAGDELVALNGEEWRALDFTKKIEQRFKPGDLVKLDIHRRGHQRTFEFPLGLKPNPHWRLLPVSAPSPEQAVAYSSWLGVSPLWESPGS